MPKGIRKIPKDRNEIFWSRVNRLDDNACWEWIGYMNTNGYGEFTVNRVKLSPHRLSYEIAYGDIPKGMFVCHHCDNPKCCNPEHLFIGTSKDNMIDAARKGRTSRGDNHYMRMFPEKVMRHEKNGSHKLTEEQVSEIREMYDSGDVRLRPIAKKYDISHVQVSNIVNRRQWK